MARIVTVDVNADDAFALTGFITTLSAEVSTDRHIVPVLRYIHDQMSVAFDEHLDERAKNEPKRFHHVYEWNMIGSPKGRLWKNIIMGSGANRIATWQWLASKKTVPVTSEAKDLGVKQIHVFQWKAPVMEYGYDIEIAPKRGIGIVAFTENGDRGYNFVKHPITVHAPGGLEVKGAFTEAYIAWWTAGGSQELFQTTLKRVLENDFTPREMLAGLKIGTRTRRKGLGMTVKAEGSAAARRWMLARDEKYINRARALEAFLYGDE